jgi:hypothetical protein
MTTPTDLSANWPVAAFDRAHLGRDHRRRATWQECCVRCVPALTARGVLPPGWPEGAAHRLVRRMIDLLTWRDTPHFRETLVTDASGRLVYHDGWDDLRAWMQALGAEEFEADPPGSLMSLVLTFVYGDADRPDPLLDRIGPDRMAAFVTKLRAEGPERDRDRGWTAGSPDARWHEIESHCRIAAALGRAAGRKFEHATLLEQAHRDAAQADRAAREGSDTSDPRLTPPHVAAAVRTMLTSGEWVLVRWQPSQRMAHGRRDAKLRRIVEAGGGPTPWPR